MAVPQTRHWKKDVETHFAAAEGPGLADKTITSASDYDATLPLGTLVPANGTARCSAYEWSQVPTATRTVFELTAADIAAGA